MIFYSYIPNFSALLFCLQCTLYTIILNPYKTIESNLSGSLYTAASLFLLDGLIHKHRNLMNALFICTLVTIHYLTQDGQRFITIILSVWKRCYFMHLKDKTHYELTCLSLNSTDEFYSKLIMLSTLVLAGFACMLKLTLYNFNNVFISASCVVLLASCASRYILTSSAVSQTDKIYAGLNEQYDETEYENKLDKKQLFSELLVQFIVGYCWNYYSSYQILLYKFEDFLQELTNIHFYCFASILTIGYVIYSTRRFFMLLNMAPILLALLCVVEYWKPMNITYEPAIVYFLSILLFHDFAKNIKCVKYNERNLRFVISSELMAFFLGMSSFTMLKSYHRFIILPIFNTIWFLSNIYKYNVYCNMVHLESCETRIMNSII